MKDMNVHTLAASPMKTDKLLRSCFHIIVIKCFKISDITHTRLKIEFDQATDDRKVIQKIWLLKITMMMINRISWKDEEEELKIEESVKRCSCC